MNTVTQLLLTWTEPVHRHRLVIGTLGQDATGFFFAYEHQRPHSLTDAVTAGFRVLDPFPVTTHSYHAPTLFPIFQRRIIPVIRSDMKATLEKFGYSIDNPLQILAVTGGRQPTDRLEFMESIALSSKRRTNQFPIAGWRYFLDPDTLSSLTLTKGTPLKLRTETTNIYNPFALEILTIQDVKIGYVPTIYSRYLEDLPESDHYTLHIAATDFNAGEIRVALEAEMIDVPYLGISMAVERKLP